MALFRLLCILICSIAAGSVTAQIQWRPVGPGAGSFLMAAAIQPDDADVMYVGGDIEGLFKTTDGGRSWTNAGPGLSNSPAGAYGVQEIVIDPLDFQRVYAATWAGLYRSDDGGLTWDLVFPEVDPEDDEILPVSYVAVDPSQSDVIYAGTGNADSDEDGTGSIYKSEDDGQSWDQLDVAMDEGATVHGVVVDPGSPEEARRIVLSSSDGIFRSTDGGESWERANSGLPHLNTRRLHSSGAGDSFTLFLSVKTTTTPPEQFDGGIYKSTDGGDNWVSISGDLPMLPDFAEDDTPYYDYWKIALHPTDDQTLYAATNLGGWGPDWGVYKTTDGGTAWTKVDVEVAHGWLAPGWWNDFSISVLRVAPSNPDILIAGTDFLHRSADGGQTWQQSYTDQVGQAWQGNGLELLVAFDFGFDPADADLWYFGYDDMGLWQSTDGGQSFSPLDPEQIGEYDATTSLAVAADGTVYAGRNRGTNDEQDGYTGGGGGGGRVMKSTDQGATWTTLSGLPAGRPTLILDTQDVLYCAVYGQGVYKTSDGGQTWESVSDGLGDDAAFAWALDLGSDGVLYVALNTLAGSGEGGIYKSANGGAEWARIYEGEDVLSVAVDPLDEQTIYAGTTDDYSWSTEGGVLKSSDGGQSWARMLAQPRSGFVLPHPTEPGLVLAASQPWWNYTPGELDRGVHLVDCDTEKSDCVVVQALSRLAEVANTQEEAGVCR